MSTAVFGAPDFKARSGRTVRSNEDGSISFQGGNGYIGPGLSFDAEEFFQARRDAELGRWRYPLAPSRVVYANAETVKIFDEETGDTVVYYRDDWPKNEPLEETRIARDAANAYRVAHPERKPWEDARSGEVWLLKDETHGDAERAYLAVNGRFFVLPPKRPIDDGWEPAAFASNFTEGERFWPASDEEEAQYIATMTPPVTSSQAGLASIRGGL